MESVKKEKSASKSSEKQQGFELTKFQTFMVEFEELKKEVR